MAEASLGCVMSATSLHFSVRKFAGEFVACAGVGFEVVSLAPSLEICGAQDGPVDTHTLCAECAFAVFGSGLPLGMRGVQYVTVDHHGLDFCEVFGQVPNHSCGLHGCLFHGNPSRKVV